MLLLHQVGCTTTHKQRLPLTNMLHEFTTCVSHLNDVSGLTNNQACEDPDNEEEEEEGYKGAPVAGRSRRRS